MKRTLCFIILVAVANSCQLPPERVPVRPLPEDVGPLPYAELLTRARLQSTAATEAFYVDQWADLEESAKGLSQTARFLNKAVEVPKSKKDALPKDAEELNKAAGELVSAAKEKDVKKSTAALQKISTLVRKLRLEDTEDMPQKKAPEPKDK
jgi:hypothetical protein